MTAATAHLGSNPTNHILSDVFSLKEIAPILAIPVGSSSRLAIVQWVDHSEALVPSKQSVKTKLRPEVEHAYRSNLSVSEVLG
jgi:hypothetical protein